MGGLSNPLLDAIKPTLQQPSTIDGRPMSEHLGMPSQGTQPPNPAMAGIRAQTVQQPAPPMMQPPSQQTTVPAMTSQHPAVKAPLGTVEGDQAHRTDLMTAPPALENVYHSITNSGFGQNHPLAGKVLGGLAQIPSTLADIALTAHPNIGGLIPGTTAQHGLQLNRANQAVTADEANREKEAQTAETQARIPLTQAQTAHTEAETAGMPEAAEEEQALKDAQIANLLHPQAKTDFEAWRQQNPTAPVEEWLKAKQKQEKPDTPEQQFIDEFTRKNPNAGIAEAVHAYAAATQKPERGPTVIQTTNEADKLAARLGKPYETALTTGQGKMDRIDQTLHSIDAGYVGQGLGIPELLTSLVSGQGTGVRITQAELNMVTRNRGIAGDAESFFNKLAGKGNLTDQDKKQIRNVLNDAKQRLSDKLAIHNQALDQINGAGSREDVVQADKQTRKLLNDLESYQQTATGKNGQRIGSKDGKQWFDVLTGQEVK